MFMEYQKYPDDTGGASMARYYTDNEFALWHAGVVLQYAVDARFSPCDGWLPHDAAR